MSPYTREELYRRIEEERQDHEWQIQEANERAAQELEQERAFNERMLFERQEKARLRSERAANSLCINADGEKILGSYSGDLNNGIPQGKGTLLFDDGSIYEGDFLGGKFHGKGVAIRNNGTIRYDGEWRNGRFNGEGVYNYSKGDTQKRLQYKGGFVNGMRVGKGVLTWEDGSAYEGEFQDNLISGYGIMKWACGACYEGRFAKGARNGYGKYTAENGYCYDGEWKDGKRDGAGKTTYPDGWSAECIWKNDVPYTGMAREYAADGKTLVYEGEIVEGKRQGVGVLYCTRNGQQALFKGGIRQESWLVGTLYYADGKVWYEGEWMGQSYYGKGVEYDTEGRIIRQGTFEKDELCGDDCKYYCYADGALRYTQSGKFVNGVLIDGVLQTADYRAEGQFNNNGDFIRGDIYKNNSLFLSGNFTDAEFVMYQNEDKYICKSVANLKNIYICQGGKGVMVAQLNAHINSSTLDNIIEMHECTIENDWAVYSDGAHETLYALDGSHYLAIDTDNGLGEWHLDAALAKDLQPKYNLPLCNSHHLVLKGTFVNRQPSGECTLTDDSGATAITETAMYENGIRNGAFKWVMIDKPGKFKTVCGTYQNGKLLNAGTIRYENQHYEGHIDANGNPQGLGMMISYTKTGKIRSRTHGKWKGSRCVDSMSLLGYTIRKKFDKVELL